MTIPDTIETEIKKFMEKFTVVVSYTKWPDENEPQYHEPTLVWNDEAKQNPKIVKSFLLQFSHSLLEAYKQEIEKKVCNDCKLKIISEYSGVKIPGLK